MRMGRGSMAMALRAIGRPGIARRASCWRRRSSPSPLPWSASRSRWSRRPRPSRYWNLRAARGSRPAASAAALAFMPSALAHHPSGVASAGGGGPISTISASTLEAGQSAAGIFFEMVGIDPFSDAQLATFAGQHIHAHSLDAILAPTLVYAYGLTGDLTLSARLPLVIRLDIREGQHSHGPAGNTVDERGDSAGIGDLT